MGRYPGIVLCVGAFEPEVDLVLSRAAGRAFRARPQWKIEVLVAGIGSVAAGLSLQRRLLDASRPPVCEVLFFGSAGVYDVEGEGPEQDRRTFGWAERCFAFDLAGIEGRGKLAGELMQAVPCASALVGDALRGLLEARDLVWRAGVTSPHSITLAPCVLSREQAAQFRFENLEAYGLASACQKSGVPFSACLALTNRVGPAGSEEWSARFRELSYELQTSAIDSFDLL